MKRIEIEPYSSGLISKRRAAPETWKRPTYLQGGTLKENEEEIYRAIKKKVESGRAKTLIRKPSSSFDYTQNPFAISAPPALTNVINLVPAGVVVVPTEIYSKTEPVFYMGDHYAGEKRVRYSCKGPGIYGGAQGIPSAIVPNALSTLYVLEGRYVKAKTYAERAKREAGHKKIRLLYAVIEAALSAQKPVLDTSSIYIEESGESLAYLPVEKKKKSTGDFFMFLVSLVVDTYTVMERAAVLEEIKSGKGLGSSFEKKVISRMYSAVGQEGWKEMYRGIQKEILVYMS